MPSKKKRCASFNESRKTRGSSFPCHIISAVDFAREIGLEKQTSNFMFARASRHFSACLTPVSVNTDRFELPWTRLSAFHELKPCLTRVIFFDVVRVLFVSDVVAPLKL
uniref:Uncharacterized protein n=1 Tax=Arundo donax TaxID=35708 RepID=A0A0A9FBE1_ARUDO